MPLLGLLVAVCLILFALYLVNRYIPEPPRLWVTIVIVAIAVLWALGRAFGFDVGAVRV